MGIFACLLRKAGIDVMVIKDLGRWVGKSQNSATIEEQLRLAYVAMTHARDFLHVL